MSFTGLKSCLLDLNEVCITRVIHILMDGESQ